MSGSDGYGSDEGVFVARKLSFEEAEGLLEGRLPDDRPDLARLAEAIAGLRSACVIEPPVDVRDRHVDAAVAAALEASPVGPVEAPVAAHGRPRLRLAVPSFAAKIVLSATVTLALGVGAAAAGILPDPIQTVAANVATLVGVDLPRPTTTTTTSLTTTTSVLSSSTTTETTIPAEESTTTTVAVPQLTAVLAMSSDVVAVDEPGDVVTFTIEVTNTAGRAVTVVELADDAFGSLLDADNPRVAANTCAGDQIVLAAGQSFGCSFEAFVSGRGGDPDLASNATVTVADSHGVETTASASVAIAINDLDPIVALEVSPMTAGLSEPGGDLTVDVAVTNGSGERVIVTSLTDDLFGNLLDPNNPGLTANTCPALAGGHRAGATMTCTFTATVHGDAAAGAATHSIRVVVADIQGNYASSSKALSIAFADVLPAVSVSVSPSAISVAESGTPVTFSVAVTNQGMEPVDLALLFDRNLGDLLHPDSPAIVANTCATLPTMRIEAGASLACSYQTSVTGATGSAPYVASVVARAFDNEANPATGTGTASVGLTFADTAVGGFVFADLDGDGIHDPGESGLAGVSLTVTVPGLGSTTVTTGTNGSWSASATPGNVTVSVLSGSTRGMRLTTDNAIQTVTAHAGVTVYVQPIGYAAETIEGYLYVDFNGNGRRDANEPGVPGATVDLLGAGGGVVDTVVTGPSGHYVFRPDPGGYVISVERSTLISGLVASSDLDSTADGTIPVIIGSGETLAGIDFGHRGPMRVDQSLIAVAPNAVVDLAWAGFDGAFGTGDEFVLTTTADGNGRYAFTNLPNGQYAVTTE